MALRVYKAALCPCSGGAGRAGLGLLGFIHARLVAGGAEASSAVADADGDGNSKLRTSIEGGDENASW